MNAPSQVTASYWGNATDYRDLLERIDSEIGPKLEANAATDEAAGELTAESFAALKTLHMSHSMVPETMGGLQLRPTEVMELLKRITWYSGAAGWVSMVHTAIGAMSAAFLPETATRRLFAPDSNNRFSGQGAPFGMLKKTEGGYILNGKWSYGSGFSHATYSHSAAFIDDGNGKPLKDEKGEAIIMCVHAPISEHDQLGGWDVLGLKATGSIDYGARDIFIPDDLIFPIKTAEPQVMPELFSLGVIGLAALGHTSWALGAGRRMLDEIAGLACAKTGRAGMLGESDKFWYDYGRAEARMRAAEALAQQVWSEIEATVEDGRAVNTRQISLVHLAKNEAHEAADAVAQFAYRAGGGVALREGLMQRIYRDIMVALNHITNAPTLTTSVGRELGGLWSERRWQYYDLIEG